MKKYLVVGDYTIGKDNDYHFIPAYKLRDLYKLNADECDLYDRRNYERIEIDDKKVRIGGIPIGTYDTILYPRNGGNYDI